MNNEEVKKVKALLVLIANAVLDLANALSADEPKEEPVEPVKEESKAEEPKVAEPVPEKPMPIELPKEEPKPVEKKEQELISSFDQFGNVVFVPRIKH